MHQALVIVERLVRGVAKHTQRQRLASNEILFVRIVGAECADDVERLIGLAGADQGGEQITLGGPRVGRKFGDAAQHFERIARALEFVEQHTGGVQEARRIRRAAQRFIDNAQRFLRLVRAVERIGASKPERQIVRTARNLRFHQRGRILALAAQRADTSERRMERGCGGIELDPLLQHLLRILLFVGRIECAGEVEREFGAVELR